MNNNNIKSQKKNLSRIEQRSYILIASAGFIDRTPRYLKILICIFSFILFTLLTFYYLSDENLWYRDLKISIGFIKRISDSKKSIICIFFFVIGSIATIFFVFIINEYPFFDWGVSTNEIRQFLVKIIHENNLNKKNIKIKTVRTFFSYFIFN